MVTMHYTCSDPEDGSIIDSTLDREEPVTMELGVGDIVGNPLLQALDSAVRGLGVGDAVKLKVSGGPYNKDLLFKVPADHPEVARLQGRYKSQGGLVVDKVIELANGNMAKVLDVNADFVAIDANNMLAGTERFLEVAVIGIERPGPE